MAPLTPPRCLGLLALAAVTAMGPWWSPDAALLLGDAGTYFPALYAALPAAWDPWVQGGAPLLPNPQAGFFYPPAWLLRDVQAGLPLYAALHLFAAGAFTWAWLRRALGDDAAALLGGLVAVLCGPAFSLVITPDKLPGYALTPAVLLAVHGAAEGRRWALPAGSCSVAGMWFGGSIEGLIVAGMSAPLWAVFLPGRPPSLFRAVPPLAMLALGTGLAGCLVVPFSALLPETSRATPLPLAEAMARSTHPVDWLGWLTPNPFWSGENLRYEVGGVSRSRWLRSLYGGLSAIALLPALLARRPPGVPLALAGALGFVALALGDASPLAPLVHGLPGLGSVRYPDKWWLGTVPLQCFLVAAAALAARTPQGSRWLRGGVVAAGLFALTGLFVSPGGAITQAWSAARWSMSGVLLVGVASALQRSRSPWSRWANAALLLGVSGDLLLAGWRALPVSDGAAHRSTPPAAAAIQADWGRASEGPPRLWDETLHRTNRLPAVPYGEPYREAQRDLLVPNVGVPWGIAYIDGMRATRLARQAAYSGPLEHLEPSTRRALLRAIGNDYWLTFDFAEALPLVREHGLRPVPAAADFPLNVGVLAEPEPLPRLRWAGTAVVVEDPGAAFRAMGLRNDDLPVVVRGDPGVGPLPSAATGPTAFEAANEGAGRWVARYEAADSGLVVLQESWAPGWSVSVDDGPWEPAMRAEHHLVAALAPDGSHVLRLRYRPAGLPAGAALSMASLLALAAATRSWPRRRGAALAS